MSLIIGDGDSSRKDRANLFSTAFTKVGIATGTHTKTATI